MKTLLRVLVALVALLLAAAVPGPGTGPSERRNVVVPPNAYVLHAAYEDWAVAWWKWANEIPYEQNPLVDTTGAYCGVGQSGKVFFLAGLWGFSGTAVERECTIPLGKFLFFPVANALWLTLPGDVAAPPDSYKGTLLNWYAKIRDLWFDDNFDTIVQTVRTLTDGEIELAAEIDGLPVRNLSAYRIDTTDAFYVDLPDHSLWTDLGAPREGTYGPAVDSGSTYLMLRPLSPGTHTLHLSWRVYVREWGLDEPYDVFYTLHVGRGL